MSKQLAIVVFLLFTFCISAQDEVNKSNEYSNLSNQMLNANSKLSIGGYGEVHYNKVLSDKRTNGILDAHRMVLFFGYNFNEKTKFITEIETEYAKELWVEQMFVQHTLNKYVDLRAGILLIPMGIINENHEPVSFNGVERPVIDNKIAPSTWREIGIGASGSILPLSLKYQLYLVNGPASYVDGKAMIGGKDGFRNGRQKASKSFMSSPNFTGRIEYFGFSGLSLGLSGYFGNTQSSLYNNLDESNNLLKQKADSSVIGIAMLGADARYNKKGLQLRAQLYNTSLSNTLQFNSFAKTAGKLNDLGNSMFGYYVEAGYNVLRFFPASKMELVPFIRYQDYNLHNSVNQNITANKEYKANIITTGLTLKLTNGAVVKTDIDFAKTEANPERVLTFNAGIGVTF